MKLKEFNKSPKITAQKALKEHFDINLPLKKMNLVETRNMLKKVRSLINESKQTIDSHHRENNSTYLKLVFMEQALSHHYGELKTLPMYNTRIVVENEEVQKSQVILAAQELADSIQKMVEDVSDMLVKELPAITDGVNNEIGTNEGSQFNSKMSETLTTLQQALNDARSGVTEAIGIMTGEGGEMAMPGEEEPDMSELPPEEDEMGSDMGGAEEFGAEQPEDMEEPELDTKPAVGRELR